MDLTGELVRNSETGNIEEVKRLLDAGADINKPYDGNTPLYAAAKNDHTAIVNELLLRGAKPNESVNRNKIPLHLAVINGNVDIARILLNNGAGVNATDSARNTPLHRAVRRIYNEAHPEDPRQSNVNYVAMINLLIERRANVNATDVDGLTPLHYAATKHYPSIIRILHAAGADMNIMDNHRETAVDMLRNVPAIVDLLTSLGGRPSSNIPVGSRILSSITGLFKHGGRKTKKRVGRKTKTRKHRKSRA